MFVSSYKSNSSQANWEAHFSRPANDHNLCSDSNLYFSAIKIKERSTTYLKAITLTDK
jgi:hypothetical protein